MSRNLTTPPPRPLPLLPLLMAVATLGCDGVSPPPANDPPAGDQPPRVIALGSLEPAGGVIAIGAAPGDRLKQLDPDVELNQRIPVSGVLGLMASYDTRLAQLDALRTKRRLAAEKHKLDTDAAGARLMTASASLAQARAKLEDARRQQGKLTLLRQAAAIATEEHDRLAALDSEDPELVTDLQLRRQANRVAQTENDLETAERSFKSAVRVGEQSVAAAEASEQAARRGRDRLDALNPVKAIDAEIRLAEQALAQSVLWTPDKNPADMDATAVQLIAEPSAERGPYTVLKVLLSPGEAVTRTPVLQVADLRRIVCVAEVYEADAKHVRVGQRATIRSAALAVDLAAKVESVSRIVAGPGLTARNPLAPVDRSVVEVRLAIDPADAEATAEAGRWIGLQVEVAFEPSAEKERSRDR